VKESEFLNHQIAHFAFTFPQLMAIGDVFCVRGYWDPPANTSKYAMIEWFKSQMQQVGLVDLRDNLYFPNSSGKCTTIV